MNILIADDHSIVRRGIREIIQHEFRAAYIEEVCDAEALVQKALNRRWDVIVTDISMPGRSGLEALQQIRLINPKVPVIVLSIFPEEQYAIRAIRNGASGYLTKEAAPEELVAALHCVLKGKRYLTPAVAERLVVSLSVTGDEPLHETLSDREFEVMKLLAKGHSSSQIAKQLSVGITTVSTYRSRILEKMKMASTADVVRYSLEKGLI